MERTDTALVLSTDIMKDQVILRLHQPVESSACDPEIKTHIPEINCLSVLDRYAANTEVDECVIASISATLLNTNIEKTLQRSDVTGSSKTLKLKYSKDEFDVKSPIVSSLPLDALHCIASFMSPPEWAQFGKVNRASRRVCREIFRRVRVHGFRCAAEVITAWRIGQHADAKELASLYIQYGVPIYPRSLGYSYQTILWRMNVEVKQMEESQVMDEQASEISASYVDQFYENRSDFRSSEGYGHQITYLSEKVLFWSNKKKNECALGVHPIVTSGHHPIVTSGRAPETPGPSRPNDTLSRLPRTLTPTFSLGFTPKLAIKIHEHLLLQHALGHDFVDDYDGKMVTPLVSLSSDFFHPSLRLGSIQRFQSILLPAEQEKNTVDAALDETDQVLSFQGFLEDFEVGLENRNSSPEQINPISRKNMNELLGTVEVEVYSSSMTETLNDETTNDSTHELKKHLRTRFTTYQRRLEALVAQNNFSAFDECILDFWDEFFPHTAGIYYHDRHTPVPRNSCLKKFLTSPCPKAIGVVQCEIGRFKTTSRGKRVNVKGRLFPTYEYRLFIRNHPSGSASVNFDDSEQSATTIRRDTIMMMAKNRGRRHTEASLPPTKKGSNNYYLYLPQQSDVDHHFNEVNSLEQPRKFNPNGASIDPVIKSDDNSSILLGRLQSNFIGTEFEIFTPHLKKQNHKRIKSDILPSFYHFSEDDLDYDSGFSSDNTPSRKSRFRRLALRRPSNLNLNPISNNDLNSVNSELSPIPSVSSSPNSHCYQVKRTASCSDLPHLHRSARINRRAIANTPNTNSANSNEPSLKYYEEENGVITYTANLLGSRPRIMDVCIPRVSMDGLAGREWKQYLENGDDFSDEWRMLNCFRQLQQRLIESPDPQTAAELVPPQARLAIDDGHGVDENAETEQANDDVDVPLLPEDFGLLALQNRPPWWNVELGSFVLNFGGRVSVASVKNFQLCERHDHDCVMLQFGRIQGRHSFTMDFQHPLSAVQAFSIAISSLQSKISFG